MQTADMTSFQLNNKTTKSPHRVDKPHSLYYIYLSRSVTQNLLNGLFVNINFMKYLSLEILGYTAHIVSLTGVGLYVQFQVRLTKLVGLHTVPIWQND